MRLRKLEKAWIVTGYHACIALRKIAPVASLMGEVTLANHRHSDFERFERVIGAFPRSLGAGPLAAMPITSSASPHLTLMPISGPMLGYGKASGYQRDE
jgi:DNA-binding Lrp family transcriptional regulator